MLMLVLNAAANVDEWREKLGDDMITRLKKKGPHGGRG
jgi:hypothetical protein